MFKCLGGGDDASPPAVPRRPDRDETIRKESDSPTGSAALREAPPCPITVGPMRCRRQPPMDTARAHRDWSGPRGLPFGREAGWPATPATFLRDHLELVLRAPLDHWALGRRTSFDLFANFWIRLDERPVSWHRGLVTIPTPGGRPACQPNPLSGLGRDVNNRTAPPAKGPLQGSGEGSPSSSCAVAISGRPVAGDGCRRWRGVASSLRFNSGPQQVCSVWL